MIKIEVTGNSIAEVADKLTALARSLSTTASYDADNAARQALQDNRDAQKKPVKAKPDAGKADAVQAETSASTAGGTGSSTETKTAAAAEEPATPDAPKALDFDKDVAPVVLNAVKVHTKEWVQEVLSQFGFARASQVPDEQLPDLVTTLQAGPQ